MLKDCVLVLGSGKSILNLTKSERELLNTCEVKIGINKYAAFYELAGIEPSHVYFHDDHYESSVLFFQYLIKKIKKNRLKNITLIVSESTAKKLIKNKIQYYINTIIFYHKKIFKNKYPKKKVLLIPKNYNIQTIRIENYIKKCTPWAKKKEDPLYHFKGSFSTVLNYISIFYPNKTVLLVGVDFNTSDYFFESELEKLSFETKDWTYELRKNHNKHYSVIETDGVKMDEELPFMIDELAKTNNKMLSLNIKSYLVENGFVKSVDLKDFKLNE